MFLAINKNFCYLDDFRKGKVCSSSVRDFRTIVKTGDFSPWTLDDQAHIRLFQSWMDSRGFTLETAREYLNNPEQPPPVPQACCFGQK